MGQQNQTIIAFVDQAKPKPFAWATEQKENPIRFYWLANPKPCAFAD